MTQLQEVSLINKEISKMKKLRLERKRRTFKKVVALGFITITALTILSFQALMKHYRAENATLGYQKVQITVKQGDTLWNLQKSITPNGDIEKILYLDSKINDKTLSNIKPGDSIVLLKEED